VIAAIARRRRETARRSSGENRPRCGAGAAGGASLSGRRADQLRPRCKMPAAVTRGDGPGVDAALRQQAIARDVRAPPMGSGGPEARSGFAVGDEVELLQPGGRLAVARGAVVTPRRQRAARAHLRRVGNAAALELALPEETLEEHPQVRLDLV